MSTENETLLMTRALRLAARGLFTTDPNPRVGCVLVRDGEVIGEGWHLRAGGPHAEVFALREAGERARGATAYVTLEPCSHHGRTPPCAQALIDAGVDAVVVAMEDPNPAVSGRGLAMLADAGIKVRSGLLAAEAAALNPGYIRRMRNGLPLVRVKLAMSPDGRTAMDSGQSQWITGSEARRDVQRLRARSSSIVTGIGTVLADNPSMALRDLPDGYPEGDARQPLRVVVDPRLSTPVDARILAMPGEVLVATAVDDPAHAELLSGAGADVVVLPGGLDQVNLAALLQELARRENNEVLVEAGAVLAGGFLKAGLIDELIVYMAPLLMGDGARGLFHLPGLDDLQDCLQLDIQDIRAVGRDWRIQAVPGKPRSAV